VDRRVGQQGVGVRSDPLQVVELVAGVAGRCVVVPSDAQGGHAVEVDLGQQPDEVAQPDEVDVGLDVVAEGVSLAITLRQEYASVIRVSGIDGLVSQLRTKIEAGAFTPE